ncbi:hypothetical protein K439DRAFT_1611792 [Ramaria rubella]|nr:hypothetical protein K439DRAFT_1611792 [Ramaria rubella]
MSCMVIHTDLPPPYYHHTLYKPGRLWVYYTAPHNPHQPGALSSQCCCSPHTDADLTQRGALVSTKPGVEHCTKFHTHASERDVALSACVAASVAPLPSPPLPSSAPSPPSHLYTNFLPQTLLEAPPAPMGTLVQQALIDVDTNATLPYTALSLIPAPSHHGPSFT